MSYICPICGFPDLKVDPEYIAPIQICPSCFFHFRYDDNDRGYTYDQWRKEWIAAGMKWAGSEDKKPPNWDPVRQLQNLTKLPKEK